MSSEIAATDRKYIELQSKDPYHFLKPANANDWTSLSNKKLHGKLRVVKVDNKKLVSILKKPPSEDSMDWISFSHSVSFKEKPEIIYEPPDSDFRRALRNARLPWRMTPETADKRKLFREILKKSIDRCNTLHSTEL